MVVLAMYTLNFLHPGILLAEQGASMGNALEEEKYADATKSTTVMVNTMSPASSRETA